MKKRILASVFAITATVALTACGQSGAFVLDPANPQTSNEIEEAIADELLATEEMVGDIEIGDYPSNAFEERIGKYSFESYDEIIGLLEGDEAYALINVKGYDGQVLLVAESTYDDLLGHMATIDCTPYTMKANGLVTADSILSSGGTATPISIDSDGVIYTVTHVEVGKNCYGENGTENPALMMLAAVYTDGFDDNGEPTSVGGFLRTKNSLVDDDIRFIEENETDVFKQLYADYEKTEVISFTVVK